MTKQALFSAEFSPVILGLVVLVIRYTSYTGDGATSNHPIRRTRQQQVRAADPI